MSKTILTCLMSILCSMSNVNSIPWLEASPRIIYKYLKIFTSNVLCSHPNCGTFIIIQPRIFNSMPAKCQVFEKNPFIRKPVTNSETYLHFQVPSLQDMHVQHPPHPLSWRKRVQKFFFILTLWRHSADMNAKNPYVDVTIS